MRGKEADASVVKKIKPDVVFVAAGGVHGTLQIPGIDKPNVVTSAKLHARLNFLLKFLSPGTLRWLSRFYMPVGKKVVIIGGGIQGCETAELLIKRGREVTIVESAGMLGAGMTPIMKDHLLLWFERKGVPTFTGIQKYVEITDKGLTFVTADGTTKTVEADTVLTVLPLVPNMRLAQGLKGKVSEVYAIGDCNEPLQIADAIAAGIRTARDK
jgi:2,4-dienoyl-CoA reductase (NADPH2)